MRLYIASHSLEAAHTVKDKLESAGHEIVSRWITTDDKYGQSNASYTDNERATLAAMDEVDVRAADVLVLIAEEEGRMVPGGKHVETGIAIALHKPVYVLGRKENIFHWHPRVQVISSTDELIRALGPPAYSP